MYYVMAEIRDWSSQSFTMVRVGRKYRKLDSAIKCAKRYSVAQVIDYGRGFRSPVFVKQCKHCEVMV